jgi:hypothetical protein
MVFCARSNHHVHLTAQYMLLFNLIQLSEMLHAVSFTGLEKPSILESYEQQDVRADGTEIMRIAAALVDLPTILLSHAL